MSKNLNRVNIKMQIGLNTILILDFGSQHA